MNRLIARVVALAPDPTPLRVHRQFRLLFMGRVVSFVGLSMLVVVLSLQIYDLTGDSVHVALVNTVLGLSTLVGSLVGGVLADRCDRRGVILVSRALAVAGFVALALNAAAPSPSLAVLYAFAVWDGVTGAIGATAFAAAVPAVVPPALLPATGTLMAIGVDLGSAVAPLVAGVAASRTGYGPMYAAVAALSLLSWLFLWRLRPILPDRGDPGVDKEISRRRGPLSRLTSGWEDLREGIRFARSQPVVSAVLLMGLVQIFFASPHVLIPEFVGRHLGGGSDAVGLMYSATAFGAILASLTGGWMARVRRVGLVVVGVYVVAALGVAAFAAAPGVAVAALCMAVVGGTDVIADILRFTVLGEITPDRYRGRVQSLWSAQATVGDSAGGPVLSLVARQTGVAGAIALGGLIAAGATAAMLFTHPALRTLTRTPTEDVDQACGPAAPAADGIPPQRSLSTPPTSDSPTTTV